MQDRKIIINKVVRYLLDKGYSISNIYVDYKLQSICADIVVIDEKTGLVMLVFEIKDNLIKGRKAGIETLYKLEKLLGYEIVKYFVYPNDNNEYGFNIEVIISPKYSDGILNELQDGIISIDKIKEVQPYKLEKIEREGKRKTIQYIQIVSIILALTFFILFILEICGIFSWDSNRICVLGLILISLIVPQFNIIKFGNIKLENNRNKRHDDENSKKDKEDK